MPNRFGQISEPHTDGFWSEEIPSTNPQGRLAFGEPQTVAGRSYNVALLFKKALFPLAARQADHHPDGGGDRPR